MRGGCTLHEPPLSHLKLIPEAAFAGDVAGVGDSLLLLQLSFLLQLLDAVIDARCCDACGIERLQNNPQKVCCTQDSFI